MKIYIISCDSGSYSDSTFHNVQAFFKQEDAVSLCNKLNQLAKTYHEAKFGSPEFYLAQKNILEVDAQAWHDSDYNVEELEIT